MSNKQSVEMVPVTNKRGQLTTKPNTVRDYNNGMSGVDRFDQMLSYYQGLRKCIRWYKKIGVHFLDIFLHNSFYLTKQQQPGSFKISLLEYQQLYIVGSGALSIGNKPNSNNHSIIPFFDYIFRLKKNPQQFLLTLNFTNPNKP